MSLELYWDDELSCVLRWDFIGDWTWQEYHATVDRSRRAMLESNCERVDMIVDLRKSSRLLSGIIQHVLQDEETNIPVYDTVWHKSVIVGGGLLVQAILKTLVNSSETIRRHCATADTIDDARDAILTDRQRSLTQQN